MEHLQATANQGYYDKTPVISTTYSKHYIYMF